MLVVLLKVGCPACPYSVLLAVQMENFRPTWKHKAWALVEVVCLQTAKVSAASLEEIWACYPPENEEIFGA